MRPHSVHICKPVKPPSLHALDTLDLIMKFARPVTAGPDPGIGLMLDVTEAATEVARLLIARPRPSPKAPDLHTTLAAGAVTYAITHVCGHAHQDISGLTQILHDAAQHLSSGLLHLPQGSMLDATLVGGGAGVIACFIIPRPRLSMHLEGWMDPAD